MGRLSSGAVPMCERPSDALRPRPPRSEWPRRICILPSDCWGSMAALHRSSNIGRTWGVGPSISWSFPNQAGPRARVRQAKASQAAALATFDSVVLTALKETEQALAEYGAALDRRQALADAQADIHRAFDIAHDEYAAGSVSNLDVLTTEQSLVALDAAVAASDASLIQLQIDVFKALGGGWQN